MILDRGDKVLIVHRRLFDGDSIRFFVGVVDSYEDGIAKVTGHTWIREPFSAALFKKEGARTKIFSISSGTLIVYQLPIATELSSVRFEDDRFGRIWIGDGKDLRIDLSESEGSAAAKQAS